MRAPNGEEHDVSGVYREVVPNEKLVFTWAWKTMPERKSLVTVLLKPDGDGTLLTLTHEQFFDDDARDRHQGGWNGAMDKMEKLFAWSFAELTPSADTMSGRAQLRQWSR